MDASGVWNVVPSDTETSPREPMARVLENQHTHYLFLSMARQWSTCHTVGAVLLEGCAGVN